MKLVVHIGLPKTMTTTLQSAVFPVLDSDGALRYHGSGSPLNLALKRMLQGADDEDMIRRLVEECLTDAERGMQLVSLESLVGVDPAKWEAAADRNLRCFGADAKILITLREPKSLLRSLYQQRIHEGNIVDPETFFMPRVDYDRLSGHYRTGRGEVFCIDDFSYRDLLKLYADRFSEVLVCPVENIPNCLFLEALSDDGRVNAETCARLIAEAPRRNVGYSTLAMRLTFLRERILRRMGVRTIGSSDVPLTQYIKVRRDREKITQSPNSVKSSKGNRRRLTWRRVMQDILPKIARSAKYELPKRLYLGQHYDDNVAFYQELLAAPDGYLRVFSASTNELSIPREAT